MAILPGAVEKMEPMLDPEQQNVARLEAGESSSVDFVGGHVYVALRVNDGENDPAAELRLLFDDENQEFSGDSPTRLHVERFVNGTSYAPVRVFCFPNGCQSGTFTLHNDGDSVLWLVDDSASDIEFLTEPLVLATFGACCLGVMSGIIALIFGILVFRNKSNQDGKQVSGLIIDGRVMTTDELYHAHQEQNKEVSDVPDPFVRSSTNNRVKEPISDENDLQIGEEEGGDAWKGWDEG
tara:strand:- start:537 stop:1250 length:714 start_codon:yes stop_codon:yes gene_type:complete